MRRKCVPVEKNSGKNTKANGRLKTHWMQPKHCSKPVFWRIRLQALKSLKNLNPGLEKKRFCGLKNGWMVLFPTGRIAICCARVPLPRAFAMTKPLRFVWCAGPVQKTAGKKGRRLFRLSRLPKKGCLKKKSLELQNNCFWKKMVWCKKPMAGACANTES